MVEKDVREKYVEWYLNWDSIEARRGDFEPRVPRIPVNRVFQAMSNIYKLSQLSANPSALLPEEQGRIEQCFSLRREGLDEDQIANRLSMDKARYHSWTESRSINIKFRRADRTLNVWLQARDRLFEDKGHLVSEPEVLVDPVQLPRLKENETTTLSEIGKKEKMRYAAKPKVVINTTLNTIAINDISPQSYPRMAVLAAAWALGYHQKNSSTAQQSRFALKDLIKHLAKTGRGYKSRKVKDIFKDSPIYPRKSNTRLVIYDKAVNGYYLDIDLKESRVEP